MILREGITRRVNADVSNRVSLPTPEHHLWRALVSQAEDELHYRLNNLRSMPVRDSLRPGDVLREDERDAHVLRGLNGLPILGVDGKPRWTDQRSAFAGDIHTVDTNGQTPIERMAEARLDLEAIKMMASSIGFPFRSIETPGLAWLVTRRTSVTVHLRSHLGEKRAVRTVE